MNIEQILNFLHSLYGMPGYALVLISCWIFGYMIKKSAYISNNAIPLVVVLWGTCWNMILADVMVDGGSVRLWIGRNALIGFIIGGVAWLTHKWIWKPLRAKFFPDDFNSDRLTREQCGLAPKEVDKIPTENQPT